ncbi:NAD(P)H-dependent oxidoreductase [Geothermobacter hydrogeniphilus]|uniref:Multimeric flavodoxin WrbA n=1 Tax=Geothermobacter hydrogeniphilus TaxID=1969733 RepID=A0A1X0XX60_9BACT|nr:NAD(P)H-dependent oxidoreductase [Geothermobacter hydrogeniphilus]ORJ57426.1 hypothetical protein B5V00_13920 [Geothermobacter hydrogeniphilus]
MKQLPALMPAAALTSFFILGRVNHFSLSLMRPLSLGLFLAAVWSLAVLMRSRRASALEKAICCYLGLAVTGFWLRPDDLGRLLADWPETSLYVIFMVMAVAPLLWGGEPFTTHFARRRAPPEVWEHPVFKRINLHMTGVWAGIFFSCAISTAIPSIWPALSAGPLELLFRVILPATLLLGIGLPFTRGYPAHYQRKLGLEPVSTGHSVSGTKPAGPFSPVPVKASSSDEEAPMSNSQTIVAINGSPHAGIGNTSLMLEMLRPTLKEQGLELEVINLSEIELTYCHGCAWCLEKGQCWIDDDHRKTTRKLLAAAGVILASPVYFHQVTAQMKTFIDRNLALGHKPRPNWKPGLAVSVSAGLGESDTAAYLAEILRSFGAFSVGSLTAMATNPGEFVGEEAVRQRAVDLAGDLARAVRENRRYPATDQDLRFYQFMSNLVRTEQDGVMKHDHQHWRELGLYRDFNAYIGQETNRQSRIDTRLREEWIRQLMTERAAGKTRQAETTSAPEAAEGMNISTCRELLEGMPRVFNPDMAGDLRANIQFEVSGAENFIAHLSIADGCCSFREGPADRAELTVKTPGEVWLAIAQGKLDGQQALISGQYTTRGNLGLLLKLKTLFSRAPQS